MITLIQYAGQNVSPENDASVYNALARGANSCLTPIEANINEAGNIAFTDGYMIIQGRVVHLESHTITPALPTGGTATGTIYIEIDITNADAPCQIKTTVGAFTPIKQDINLGGTLYQHKIGTYSATQNGIVSGSISTSLPNSADTSFSLGYKNSSTGRISMGASENGAYFHIYDRGDNGMTRASMFTSTDSGIVALKKNDGTDKFLASGGASGGQVYCKHSGNIGENKNAVELGARGTGADSRGYLSIADKVGTTKVEFDGEDGCKFNNNAGSGIFRIGYDSDGGRLIIYNKDGAERVRIGIKGNGAGKIEIIDENGNTHNVLTD